jgi:hypothetical protein
MKKEAHKHYIEILPAACMSQRGAWQELARSLPVGACLLVTNLNDRGQTRLMQTLAQAFRRKGRRVVVWYLNGKKY